jgi:hypothetical protein
MDITLEMSSTRDWSTLEKAHTFVDLLALQSDALKPETYGTEEPTQISFVPLNLSEFINIWQSGSGYLLIGRKRPPILSGYLHQRLNDSDRFSYLVFTTNELSFKSPQYSAQLLQLARRIYEWGNVIHGSIYHAEDRKAQNHFDQPTSIVDARKVYTGGNRLEKGLPGMYWANFFGPIYVAFLGRKRFNTVPAYYKEELPDGGFLLLTSSSPLDYQLPEVSALKQSIVRHLGQRAFFDRTKPARSCVVPKFEFEPVAHRMVPPAPRILYDPVVKVIPNMGAFIDHADALATALLQRIPGLDFSPESLFAVDDHIAQMTSAGEELWEDETGRRLIRELAAYYGETVRRTLNGRWVLAVNLDEHPHPAVVFTDGNDQHIEFPVDQVIDYALERRDEDALATHYYIIQGNEWRKYEEKVNGKQK